MRRTASLTGAVLLFATLAVQAGAGNAVKASASRAPVKTAHNKTIGKKILVDSAGRTLNMFTSDISGKDTVCTPKEP